MTGNKDKWKKIKEELEKAGKTDAYFYRMALKELGLPGGEMCEPFPWEN